MQKIKVDRQVGIADHRVEDTDRLAEIADQPAEDAEHLAEIADQPAEDAERLAEAVDRETTVEIADEAEAVETTFTLINSPPINC